MAGLEFINPPWIQGGTDVITGFESRAVGNNGNPYNFVAYHAAKEIILPLTFSSVAMATVQPSIVSNYGIVTTTINDSQPLQKFTYSITIPRQETAVSAGRIWYAAIGK